MSEEVFSQIDNRLASPICVCGTGRSGTTIFFNVLGAHSDLAWTSNVVERYPRYPQLSFLSRLHPLIHSLGPGTRLGRLIPHPAESLTSIRFASDGLFQEPLELSEHDIPIHVISNVRRYFSKIIKYHGKPRLATKHTGFPRFKFWNEIFEDPFYVHVIRDGRAVAYSMMRVSWWDGTMESWWWGDMPDEYKDEYENADRKPSALAAIVWKRLLDLFELENAAIAPQFLVTVRYDLFAKSPTTEMNNVADACGLPYSRQFDEAIRKYPIHNADTAWRKGLHRNDLKIIESILGSHLERYGFS